MELLKQRLLGAIVFFSLAIIFLPEIFHENGAAIIENPGRATLPYQAALAQHSTPVVAAAAYKVASKDKESSGEESAWSVRVGAFSDPAVAAHLEQKLRQHGYATYIQSQDGRLHNVLIGPELVASNAYEVQQRLEQHLHLSGVVVPYEPVLYVKNDLIQRG